MRRRPDQSAQVRLTLASLFDGAPGASSDAAAPQTDANHPNADEDAHARTWAALQSLPGPLKKILLLREVEGLQMGEVARRLGLSRRAAERRWARAIMLMTERLAKTELRRGSK
jgi:DNA-directed RNA polymerase specialized sigma24 family protein